MAIAINTFNSSKVKPRPARIFALYFRVWEWTTGRRGPAVGRGKTATAFFWRTASTKKKTQITIHNTRLTYDYSTKHTRGAWQCSLLPPNPFDEGHTFKAIPWTLAENRGGTQHSTKKYHRRTKEVSVILLPQGWINPTIRKDNAKFRHHRPVGQIWTWHHVPNNGIIS